MNMLSDDGMLPSSICGMVAEDAGVPMAEVGLATKVLVAVLSYANGHPIQSGLAVGVAGMLIVFVLRRAIFATLGWVWAIGLAPLKIVAKPFVGLYRKVRGLAGGRRYRLPLVGETAFVGPCSTCGTKKEYSVRTTGYYGGTVRGFDTLTGMAVIGCPGCTKA
jgi:hypothetical protein